MKIAWRVRQARVIMQTTPYPSPSYRTHIRAVRIFLSRRVTACCRAMRVLHTFGIRISLQRDLCSTARLPAYTTLASPSIL